MKKLTNGSKIVIFLFGIAVLAISAFLLSQFSKTDVGKFVITCIIIAVIYILAFLPFFIEIFSSRNEAGRVISNVIYYKGMIPFTVASLMIIIFMYIGLPVRFAVIAQGICFAVFLIYFFLACFTKGHIENIAVEEEKKKSTVAFLREKTKLLAIEADQLNGNNIDLKNSLKKLAEDFRYLSPSENQAAIDLDNKMIRIIEEFLSDFSSIQINDSASSGLNEKVKELELLFKQRKSIY
ncbi:MAG: hypothetical protein K6G45_09890 [Lachnospiraceae bacterium]|nr:hypothetical protein [Lachnospiraceae bacterium]